MQFRTPIPISKSNFQIDYGSKVVSLGSCFAVNMAEKLDYYKFQNGCNPFGILFHSLAIERLVQYAVLEKSFTTADVFFHNERWHCFEAHSSLSIPSQEELLDQLNTILATTKQQLQEATQVIITYGTAWVYRSMTTQSVVANCHKLPQNQFTKELLSVKTIAESCTNTIQLIRSINPEVEFVFTVSPVRHIKDGFVENQLSKAHLITALHSSISKPVARSSYFPSYEIMMDELRDYRFYNSDMLHPSPLAVDYIWTRFQETYLSEKAFKTMESVAQVQKSLQHRAFNPLSERHQLFENQLETKISQLTAQFPFMKF